MGEDYSRRDRAVWERIFAAMPPAWFEAPPSDAMRQARAYFEANPRQRLLDLGCGFGRWALFLAGRGAAQIVGVDYALGGLRAASGWALRAGTPARFLAATATSLPFRRGSFDGVLVAVLLDNLSRADLALAVRELSHASRLGARGFFVFNPRLSEADLASISRDNPTRECMHVVYEDSELPGCLAGWGITRFSSSAEGFRLLEATYRGGDEG